MRAIKRVAVPARQRVDAPHAELVPLADDEARMANTQTRTRRGRGRCLPRYGIVIRAEPAERGQAENIEYGARLAVLTAVEEGENEEVRRMNVFVSQ